MKRRLESSSRFESSSIEDIESTTTSNSEEHDDSDASTSLISMVSPSSKKRALRRLKLSSPAEHIKRKFHLDKVVVADSTRESELKTKIINFLNLDENSLVVPDIKKAKKGLKYRLLPLKELHEKFMSDEVECSYTQFTRCVPINSIKPKPEDWGTCLCVTCLNPELKLESFKKHINTDLTIANLKNPGCDKEKIEQICQEIAESNFKFEYLEWSKERGTDLKITTYHSKKNALSADCNTFAKKFQTVKHFKNTHKSSQHNTRG